MSHMWMGHVPFLNESCPTCHCVMFYVSMCHVTHMDESSHKLSHILIQHSSHACGYKSCHTNAWVMWYVWLDDVTNVNTSILHIRQYYTYVKNRCINLKAATLFNLHVTRVNLHVTRVNVICHTCECGMSHVWISHVTRVNESCHAWMSECWTCEDGCCGGRCK